ncbi:MAG: DUF3467 domain-containing protein [Deltaproteobacteria bacterium]|nr:DUF3467 domain-containing protein [Deltaproteobacteria bacterium]
MADEKPPKGAQQIPIVTGDEMSRGRYSNNMLVTHSSEEFIIDWLLNSPSGTHMVSRVIVSTGHMKRIIDALTENMRKHESKFGSVKAVETGDPSFH